MMSLCRRVALALILALLVLCGPQGCSQASDPKAPPEDLFALPPAAFHPTETTVVISAMATSDLEVRVRYGTSPESFDNTSSVSAAKAEVRHETTLSKLTPGTVYYYEVQSRTAASEAWRPSQTNRFRTARQRDDSTFSFVVGGDDHSVVAYSRTDCGSPEHHEFGILAAFYQTQKNMLSREADFYLNAGDTSNNHGFVQPGCSFEGRDLGSGTIGFDGEGSSFRQAQARWSTWLRNNRLVMSQLPLFLAMGNHDGEQSWGNKEGDCAYMKNHPTIRDTHLSSEAARLAVLPNPAHTYDGHSSGAYYSFVWGDAEIFVLDPHKFGVSGPGAPYDGSHSFPEDASDWTLGREQLAWLERALRQSDRKWKLLISHHLLGGITSGNCYHYGRGNVGSTDTGKPTGTFLGEQAEIQALMEATGAQVFMLGHDHIALAAEKKNRDGSGSGVHYITVGMLGFETPPGWINDANFIENSDVNGDGVADYDPSDKDHGTPEDHGSMEKGHFRATVKPHKIEFCYYRSLHRDDASNNELEFCYPVTATTGRPS